MNDVFIIFVTIIIGVTIFVCLSQWSTATQNLQTKSRMQLYHSNGHISIKTMNSGWVMIDLL